MTFSLSISYIVLNLYYKVFCRKADLCFLNWNISLWIPFYANPLKITWWRYLNVAFLVQGEQKIIHLGTWYINLTDYHRKKWSFYSPVSNLGRWEGGGAYVYIKNTRRSYYKLAWIYVVLYVSFQVVSSNTCTFFLHLAEALKAAASSSSFSNLTIFYLHLKPNPLKFHFLTQSNLN